MTVPDINASGIAWDLGDLYAAPDDPALRADLDEATRRAAAFAAKYRGTIDTTPAPEPEWVAAAVAEIESISEQAARPAIYAGLLHAADVRPPAHGALVAMTQERGSEIRNLLLFFDLEWIALADEPARKVIDSSACRRYRHFLATARRYRPHMLSEAEEKLLEDKANTGGRAFSRLFDELLSSLLFEVEVDGETQALNESALLALLYDGRRALRQAAARALTKGLEANGLVLTFVFNTLVQDHAIDDRLRSFRDPMDSRHLANEIDAATVAALMDACEAGRRGRRGLLRAQATAARARASSTITTATRRSSPRAPPTGWPACRELVLSAYHDFSPRMSEIAALFFERRWIDAEPRDGKRGGAFSASTVPRVHPYVLVNYTGRARDVMTVAHELGHGVHQYLSRAHGYSRATRPDHGGDGECVRRDAGVRPPAPAARRDPRGRLALLCGKIEDTFATVFRQITLTRFEQQLHAARRHEGELSWRRHRRRCGCRPTRRCTATACR